MDKQNLKELLAEIRACRHCVEQPKGQPLPHEPRPVLRVSKTARICICGQAPGTRVHASGKPFTDPSGDRLRKWMGVNDEEFYDETRVSIIPMGFCFPGLDAKGGDLPPRKECAPLWRDKIFANLSNIECVLLIGQYAQKWHLRENYRKNVTETVRSWQEYIFDKTTPIYLPLPHPSWRNNIWIKNNPWFYLEVLPFLKMKIKELL